MRGVPVGVNTTTRGFEESDRHLAAQQPKIVETDNAGNMPLGALSAPCALVFRAPQRQIVTGAAIKRKSTTTETLGVSC